MLVLASFVIQNPWLQFIGALYLLKISVAELGHLGEEEDHSPANRERLLRERSFWGTVLTVELMDLAFSLDNVVVVITLSDQLWLILLGVAVGILTMRFAAGAFTGLIERFPALGPAAYALVFFIGVEFILKHFGVDVPEAVRFAVNISILLGAVVYSRWHWLQRALNWPFRVFRAAFFGLDWVIAHLFQPLGWGYRKLAGYFRLSPGRISKPQA